MLRKHPSRKDILRGALDPQSMNNAMKNHLDACDSCRHEYLMSRTVLEPSPYRLPDPDKAILNRIIANFRQGAPSKTKQRFQGFLTLSARPAMAAVIAVFIIAVIFAGYFGITRPRNGIWLPGVNLTIMDKGTGSPSSLALSSLPGIVKSGSVEKIISLDNIMKINIGKDTYLTVDLAEINRDGKKYNIVMTLQSGSLHARLQHDGDLKAIFRTPHGSVTPLGTEFRITVSPDDTVVHLKEGVIEIRSKEGATAVMRPGDRAVLNSSITLSSMKKQDNAFFNEPRSTAPPLGKVPGKETATEPDEEKKGGITADKEEGRIQKKSLEKARKEQKDSLRNMRDVRRTRRGGRT